MEMRSAHGPLNFSNIPRVNIWFIRLIMPVDYK